MQKQPSFVVARTTPDGGRQWVSGISRKAIAASYQPGFAAAFSSYPERTAEYLAAEPGTPWRVAVRAPSRRMPEAQG